MKRLLLGVVLCSSIAFPPVQAYCYDCHSHHCYHDDLGPKVVLSVAAAVIGIVGIGYVVSIFPSHRYSSAQKTYAALDECLNNVRFDAKSEDIADVATQWFPNSPYPLVAAFNYLNSVHEDAKGAIEKLENAVWWSKEEYFVRSCNRLKDQIKERVVVLKKVNQLVRSNPEWATQYALYLQQCNNDQLRDISWQIALNGLNHCCH
jgi:hypothetical protein